MKRHHLIPLLLLVAACGGGGDGSTPPSPVTVSLSPSTITLLAADSADAAVSLSGGGAGGAARLTGCALGDPAVGTATVIGSACRVVGRAPGTTTLVATASTGETGTAAVVITARPPALRIVAGAAATDTIEATVPLLVVEVRDANGRAAAGAEVVFETEPNGTGGAVAEWATLCAGDAAACLPVGPIRCIFQRPFPGPEVGAASRLVARTDSLGRASARVQLGRAAGSGVIRIASPVVARRDSVTVTVLPGRVSGVRAIIERMMITVGDSLPVDASAVDRCGNPRPEPVRLSVTGSAVETHGVYVVATRVGEGRLVAATAVYSSDTIVVAGVPAGTIAVTAGRGRLLVGAMDGSHVAELAPREEEATVAARSQPAWSPDGQELAFQELDAERTSHVYTAVPGGQPRRLAPSAPMHQLSPRYSADGLWIYFGAGTPSTLWRARRDGSGAEPVTLGPDGEPMLGHSPAPSPDGRHLVFARGLYLMIADLVTGSERVLAGTGSAPRWSPDGEWVAYVGPPPTGSRLGGNLRAVRANGTGYRVIGPATASFDFSGLDWSPDGRWLLAARRSELTWPWGLQLVGFETGEVVQLYHDSGWVQAAWRPIPSTTAP